MNKALLSIACLLGAIGAAPAAGPGRGYHVELVIHQGPEKGDGSSVLSCPVMCLAEGRPGQVSVGQSVRLWEGEARDIGVRAEGEIRRGRGGLILRLRLEHSEVIRDTEGRSQIGAARAEFDRTVRLDAPFVAKPAHVGEKSLWAEVRVKPTPP
jgi:hypothetical protein